jgi:hypothetical protein
MKTLLGLVAALTVAPFAHAADIAVGKAKAATVWMHVARTAHTTVWRSFTSTRAVSASMSRIVPRLAAARLAA